MDYLFFEGVLSVYGAHSIIIALLICVFRFVLKRYAKKINDVTKSYLEIALALLLELGFTLIYFKDISAFSYKSVSSAIISYSTSLIITSVLARIFSGKSINASPRLLAVEGIIKGMVVAERLTEIAGKIAECLIQTEIDTQLIFNLVKDNLQSPTDNERISAVVDLIITTAKDIKD